jgi:hypothetical protein
MIILSLMGHLLVLSIIILIETGSKRLIQVPHVYTVNLISQKSVVTKPKPEKKRIIKSGEKSSKKPIRRKQKKNGSNNIAKVSPFEGIEDLQMVLKRSKLKISSMASESMLRDLFRRSSRKNTERTGSSVGKESRVFSPDTPERTRRTEKVMREIKRLDLETEVRKGTMEIKKGFQKVIKETQDMDLKRTANLPSPKVASIMNKSTSEPGEIINIDRLKGLSSRSGEIVKGFSELEKKELDRMERTGKKGRDKESVVLPEYQVIEWEVGNASLRARLEKTKLGTKLALTIAEIIRNRIEANWELDEYVARRGDYESQRSVVNIRVAPDGRIVDVFVKKASVNAVFQKSVMKALEESNPLMLGGFNLKDSFDVELTFSPI